MDATNNIATDLFYKIRSRFSGLKLGGEAGQITINPEEARFFDFDYMVECFVPQPKRKYGYFSLPILIGDTFVARMDSKADRQQRTLTIHNLHFEKVKLSKPQITKLCDAIKAFATFNQCRAIVLKKSNDKVLMKVIQKVVA